ncbi:uncharacterized protein C9orf85 homolog [Penaeus monodon]|uniref:uncharacterized protein C9orf85 homolog n=1 Tax=Penaeus monodon TaxID=6687 RepID=UPI0018A749A4|nr:uncharacterized protein C9orf85 homolog [Penaeus monodon]
MTTDKKTKKINSTEVAEVCKRCQEIIEWKIKYKKYKPLSQAKTCTKCHNKAVKDAYHTICIPCASNMEVCCKCGKKEEIVQHKAPTKTEKVSFRTQRAWALLLNDQDRTVIPDSKKDKDGIKLLYLFQLQGMLIFTQCDKMVPTNMLSPLKGRENIS